MIRRLDLIRHAHALPSSPDGDSGRVLSPEGIAAARALAGHLRATSWNPDLVCTSPLARAHQTAELLVEGQSKPIAIEVLEALITEEDPAAVWSAIADAARGREHVAAVGHQPMIGLLIERLTGESVAVPPGSLHAVELDEDSGSGGRMVARAQAES